MATVMETHVFGEHLGILSMMEEFRAGKSALMAPGQFTPPKEPLTRQQGGGGGGTQDLARQSRNE